MKSRIKFDLGENNQEVITATVTTEGSDDVRDRIAKCFSQKFNGSSFCLIEFNPSDPCETRFTITPISDDGNTGGDIYKHMTENQRAGMSLELASRKVHADPSRSYPYHAGSENGIMKL